MKIGVIGDSHLQSDALEQALEVLGEIDFLIHTGDLYYDFEYLIEKLKVPGIGVRGNCDVKGPEEVVELVAGKRFLVTHGHQYGVKGNVNRLFYRGKEVEADFVVFGHSHVPYHTEAEGMVLLNPGSIAHPRGGSQKSYALIEITEEQVSVQLKTLEAVISSQE